MVVTANLAIAPIPGFSDPFSSITHLLGAGVFFALGVILLLRKHGPGRTLALLVFVVGVSFTLAMSGVYHLLTPGTTARAVLQRLDHASIFFLIAATFTPVHGILFRGFQRWGILFLIWAAAISGITLKSIFFDSISEWLGLLLYLGLGWIGAFSAYLLYHRFGFAYLKPLLYGALAYTLGAGMEYLRYPIIIPGVIGPHELFHIAVLVGISMHWLFIRTVLQHIDPSPGIDGNKHSPSHIA